MSDRALSDTVTRLERALRSDRGTIPFLLPPLCPQHFFHGAYPPQSPLSPLPFSLCSSLLDMFLFPISNLKLAGQHRPDLSITQLIIDFPENLSHLSVSFPNKQVSRQVSGNLRLWTSVGVSLCTWKAFNAIFFACKLTYLRSDDYILKLCLL